VKLIQFMYNAVMSDNCYIIWMMESTSLWKFILSNFWSDGHVLTGFHFPEYEDCGQSLEPDAKRLRVEDDVENQDEEPLPSLQVVSDSSCFAHHLTRKFSSSWRKADSKHWTTDFNANEIRGSGTLFGNGFRTKPC
jgi:hypothetical protein